MFPQARGIALSLLPIPLSMQDSTMRKYLLSLLLVIFLITPSSADQNLLRWGLPTQRAGSILLEKVGYTVSYDPNLKIPDFVIEHLDSEKTKSVVRRTGYLFTADPALPLASRAYSTQYVGTGYDRGHNAPALDNEWSTEAMADCFLMPNIAPQAPNMNRGVWRRLEASCFLKAHEADVWIVTGNIPGTSSLRGGINIPAKWWKTILVLEKNGNVRLGAWVCDNVNNDSYKRDSYTLYAVSVDNLEAITQKDFWSGLPDDKEKDLESKAPNTQVSRKEGDPSSSTSLKDDWTPRFQTLKPFSPVRGQTESLKDINSHINQPNIYESDDDLGHERTHGINSLLRNDRGIISRFQGSKINAFYVLQNRYIVLREPRFTKRHVQALIPRDYVDSSLYPLYVLDTSWADTPSHLIDEWVAYTNGSQVHVEYAKAGVDLHRGGSIKGMMQFNAFATAFVQAIDRYDPNFVDKVEYQKFVYWNLKRSVAIYEESLKYPILRDKAADAYYSAFQKQYLQR